MVDELFAVAEYGSMQGVRRALQADRELTARALLEVSRHAESSSTTETFFGRLSATVAQLVGAQRAAFFRLEPDGSLSAQLNAFGFTCDELRQLKGIPCDPQGGNIAGSIVHCDNAFFGGVGDGPEFSEYSRLIKEFGVRDVVTVAWRAGDRPIGALSASNSTSASGFSESSAWVLRVAAMAAGLVWLQKQAEARLAAAREAETATLRERSIRVEDLERAKSQFLNLASHELRGPVTVLSGYLSMFDEGSIPGVTGKARKALPLLRSKVSQINSLINDMLDAARLDDNELGLARDDIDLVALAAGVLEDVTAQASRRHRLRLERPGQAVVVNGDRDRLHAVLSNLLDNAVKYSPEGGEVLCAISADGSTATVTISDEGLGIAPEQMGRLFTRFGRVVTSETSNIPGTGIGLYLAREFARLHGGDIEVRSEPLHGSRFTVTLPLAKGRA